MLSDVHVHCGGMKALLLLLLYLFVLVYYFAVRCSTLQYFVHRSGKVSMEQSQESPDIVTSSV